MRPGVVASLVLLLVGAAAGCGTTAPRSAAEVAAGSAFEARTSASPAASGGATAGRSVLFVGDSFTAGAGLSTPSDGEACATAAALDATCLLDAEGGSGFVHDGHDNSPRFTPLIGRLASDRARLDPTEIVVDAGRDDGAVAPATEQREAGRYLTALRAAFPHARIAVVAPYYLSSTADVLGPGFVAYLRSLVGPLHLAGVVDPVTAGWTGPAAGRLVGADGVHPSPAGVVVIAAHLAPELRALGL